MRKLMTVTLSMALLGMFLTVSEVRAEPQPHMRAAQELLNKALGEKVGEGKIKHLNDAKAQLQQATHDKGGHRLGAIAQIDQALDAIKANKMPKCDKHIQQAINQVQKGIKADNKN